jgi:hypothetical protein
VRELHQVHLVPHEHGIIGSNIHQPSLLTLMSPIETDIDKNWTRYHLYVTSNSPIEEDDIAYDVKNNTVHQSYFPITETLHKGNPNFRKVVATTDRNTIKEGFIKGGINNAFVNAYCKDFFQGNRIVEVMVNVTLYEKDENYLFTPEHREDGTIIITKLKKDFTEADMRKFATWHSYNHMETTASGEHIDEWISKGKPEY